MKTQLFKCLVGSRAHGLNDEDSDYDYRGVFIVPTSEILSLGSNAKTTSWIEGEVDDTQWELGHFLHLATKCNPTILEAFTAPIENKEHVEHDGILVRGLFDYVWNSKGVLDAFCGYAHNQQKKFLDDKDQRQWKYAGAYIRVLWQGYMLLNTGKMIVDLRGSEIHGTLLEIRKGGVNKGDVINIAEYWKKMIQKAYEANPSKKTNLEAVNHMLLTLRRNYW